jgi:hypothetical protein
MPTTDHAIERVHVYMLPEQLSVGWCFTGGHPIPFRNVDWFDADPAPSERAALIAFVRKKRYCISGHRYLILGESFAEIIF